MINSSNTPSTQPSDMNKMRLAKYLSHCGVCSRRQASRLIEQGLVTVNHRPANHIDHVDESDHIEVEGQVVAGRAAPLLFAYHKPVGIDCKLIASDPDSLIHKLPNTHRVYPIGRLDKDSRGLLLLTNNGDLCQQLIHPDSHQEKEYWVTVNRALDPAFCRTMAQGIPISGQVTQPCQVELMGERRFKIILKEGMNRQIRKMAKHCGYHVVDLFRVRIASLKLDSLALQEDQIATLDPDFFEHDLTPV